MSRPLRAVRLAPAIFALLVVPASAFAGAWVAPQKLAPPGASGRAPQIAFDGAGNALALFTGGGGAIVQSAYRPVGGSWQAPENVSPVPAAGETVSVASPNLMVDPNGNAAAIWIRKVGAGSFRVETAYRPAGGTWVLYTAPLSASGQDAGAPRIALAASGEAVAIWQRSDGTDTRIQAAERVPSSGLWTVPEDLSAAGQPASEPELAMDLAGNAFAIWSRRDDQGDDRIQIRIRAAAGSFGAADTLSAAGQPAANPALAIDANGVVTAAWEKKDVDHFRIQARTRPAGGAFGGPNYLSDAGIDASLVEVTADRFGTATGVWKRNGRIESATRSGTTWSASVPLSLGGAGDAEVAADASGNVAAVWARGGQIESAVRVAGEAGFGAPAPISAAGDAKQPVVAFDPGGNGVALWSRPDGGVETVEWAVFDAVPPTVVGLRVPLNGTAGRSIPMRVTAVTDSWTPTTIAWDYGDGTIAGPNSPTTRHTYHASGGFTVRLSATDAAGNTTTVVAATRMIEARRCNVNQTGRGRADHLVGDGLRDRIRGGRGNDLIEGRGGSDCLWGDAGNDTIFGGRGRDVIHGGTGNDRITGGEDGDLIDAGPGDDTLNTRDGIRDVVRCGPGRDRVRADRRDLLLSCERVRRR